MSLNDGENGTSLGDEYSRMKTLDGE